MVIWRKRNIIQKASLFPGEHWLEISDGTCYHSSHRTKWNNILVPACQWIYKINKKVVMCQIMVCKYAGWPDGNPEAPKSRIQGMDPRDLQRAGGGGGAQRLCHITRSASKHLYYSNDYWFALNFVHCRFTFMNPGGGGGAPPYWRSTGVTWPAGQGKLCFLQNQHRVSKSA